MEFHSAHFDEGLNVPSSLYSVKASTRLVEVFQRTAESGRPYLFVEDEDGQPIGVLAAADILQKITRPNPFEMRRRMDMPADSALQGRIEMPSGEFFSDPEGSHDYTKVSLNGKLLGVITDTDVLISWKSIQQTVENSQGDAVTDLPNRASFDYHLEADCNRAERWQHSVSALLVDLDHFKQINDTFGHASGDSALHVVAQALRASLRSCDMVTRFVAPAKLILCSAASAKQCWRYRRIHRRHDRFQ